MTAGSGSGCTIWHIRSGRVLTVTSNTVGELDITVITELF